MGKARQLTGEHREAFARIVDDTRQGFAEVIDLILIHNERKVSGPQPRTTLNPLIAAQRCSLGTIRSRRAPSRPRIGRHSCAATTYRHQFGRETRSASPDPAGEEAVPLVCGEHQLGTGRIFRVPNPDRARAASEEGDPRSHRHRRWAARPTCLAAAGIRAERTIEHRDHVEPPFDHPPSRNSRNDRSTSIGSLSRQALPFFPNSPVAVKGRRAKCARTAQS